MYGQKYKTGIIYTHLRIQFVDLILLKALSIHLMPLSNMNLKFFLKTPLKILRRVLTENVCFQHFYNISLENSFFYPDMFFNNRCCVYTTSI